MRPNTPETFWARVKKSASCWLWTGAAGGHGYGQLQYQGRQVTAHRLAYELTTDPVPAGLYVCHTCDVRLCVRPSHLWLGNHTDNLHDASVKGRMHRGVSHGNAKLRSAAVLLIRMLVDVGVSGVVVARRFGVHPNTVYNIAAGRIWGWL